MRWEVALLVASWAGFSLVLAANHWRVRRWRRREGIAEEGPSIRDPASMKGLVLEGAGMLVAFLFQRPISEAPDALRWLSIAAGPLSVLLLLAAVGHLGRQWRIKAVVTADHVLVTTGPYAYLRHPVFTALFLLLVATAALLSRWWAMVAAMGVYSWGTAIRVKAEDGLLHRRFGERFEQYRRRVPGWVPFFTNR